MALNFIPNSGQSLGQTRNGIRQNFVDIDAAFTIDHVSYNAAGQGKHNKVTLPVQAVTPVTIANEVALFSRTSALTGVPEMAFVRQGAGAVIEFTSSTAAAIGWTRLPSGILLKWGNSTANGSTVYTFPVGATVPAFTQIFSVVLTPNYGLGSDNPNATVRLQSYSTVSLTVWGSPRTTSGSLACAYQYFAIGV